VGWMKKAAALAASPQGRRMMDKAKRWADQPENRDKLRSLGEQVIGRRSPGWPQPPPSRDRDPGGDAGTRPNRDRPAT
jgi:hypothetical protein